MIKVTTDNGGLIEVGLPISRITKIAFAEPPELAAAKAAAATGNANAVLSLTESYVSTQGDFKEVSGSWWLEMAKLRLFALAATGKDAETAPLASQIGSLSVDGNDMLLSGGTLFTPLSVGDTEAVLVGAKALPRIGSSQGAALAQLALGRALLVKKDYVGALRAFLTIKVFYPSLVLLQPEALYGAANAYVGLKDTKRALQTLQEIQKSFPETLQASEAKKLESDISKS
jgi:tetratricopeptide (TPR) repeat protein